MIFLFPEEPQIKRRIFQSQTSLFWSKIKSFHFKDSRFDNAIQMYLTLRLTQILTDAGLFTQVK